MQNKAQYVRLEPAIDGMENMTAAELFGAVVRQLRTQNGWAQIELAVKADVSQNVVSLIERGRGVQLNTAEKIAHAFGVELYELL